jgi:hypothetical protein
MAEHIIRPSYLTINLCTVLITPFPMSVIVQIQEFTLHEKTVK